MPYFSMAMRSMPAPRAKPCQRAGSWPAARSTFGWIIPQPRISIQPRSPRMSTSPEGSVKGKKLRRKRSSTSRPNKRLAVSKSSPFRSAKVVRSSTRNASIWWNMGLWVESASWR